MSVSYRHAQALVATALLLVAAPACASYRSYRYPSPSQRIDDRAYWKGYEEGREHGDKDRRDRKRFDYARHGDYRDADDGYKYGDRNAYRFEFRRGFVDGYENGYRGSVGARYPNGPGPYVYGGRDRYPVYGGRDRNPVYDGRGRYPDGDPYGNSAAFQNGYRDGYDQGRKDARDRDRFDPLRSSRYRSGDHDYDRRYGPREEYKRDYRAAFEQGYERGYREYRR